jgi:hypothetical protein
MARGNGASKTHNYSILEYYNRAGRILLACGGETLERPSSRPSHDHHYKLLDYYYMYL